MDQIDGLGRRRWRRVSLRRPSVATPALVSRTLALDFVLVGVTTLVSTLFPAESGHRHTGLVQILAVVALLNAPVLLMLKRLDWWILNPITTASTLAITYGISLDGGGTTAATSSALYLLVVVHAFYTYARLIAWLHVGFAVTMCAWVLHDDHAVGASELIVLLGVAVAISVLIGWLIRAADLAEVDFLTGLLNRRGFETAAAELSRRHPDRTPLALIMIDLDDFKTINDRYGHSAGDEYLAATTRYWRQALRQDALLARHGGDEFVVILPDVTPADTDRVIERLRATPTGGSFSAGVAFASSGESLSMWLSRADTAVYDAKRGGPGRTVTAPLPFDGPSGQAIMQALRDRQFALYYQPIIDLTTGTVIKAEALIRWMHPDRGLVPPDQFIHLAELTGTITSLGDWILSTACHDAADWARNDDGQAITVSVNASGLELQDPNYADRVLRHLAAANLPTDQLIIELVETDYQIGSRTVSANLACLSSAGVKLAMDDFGTGYSSLNRLHETRVDILKIDRSFISDITRPDQPMPMVTAIIAMARALNLQIVAEGIETPEQARWLAAHGVTQAQGYLYGHPAPTLHTTTPRACLVIGVARW